MDTMQPVLKTGRDVWDKINMPESEFRGRIANIRKAMKKDDIDILLLYGRDPNEYANPCYLTNFLTGTQRASLVALPAAGDITLIVEGFPRGLPTYRNRTWVQDIRICDDISKECASYLKEKGLLQSTIGVAGLSKLMPYSQLKLFNVSVKSATIVDCDDLINSTRMIKSSKEIDQVHRASRNLSGIFSSISGIDSVISQKAIEAVACRQAFINGAEDFRILFARPSDEKWAFGPADEARISSGDNLIVYAAIEYEKYWAEGIRTYKRISASLEAVKNEKAEALYSQILKSIKPAKSVSQLCKEVMDMTGSDFEYIPDYGLGQGIGLSLKEEPQLTAETTDVFKDGMCLSLRLMLKNKEIKGFGLGNTIHVSKKGSEILTQ